MKKKKKDDIESTDIRDPAENIARTGILVNFNKENEGRGYEVEMFYEWGLSWVMYLSVGSGWVIMDLGVGSGGGLANDLLWE